MQEMACYYQNRKKRKISKDRLEDILEVTEKIMFITYTCISITPRLILQSTEQFLLQ